jgi:hypothetical protein
MKTESKENPSAIHSQHLPVVELATATSVHFHAVPAVHNRVLVPTLLFEAGSYPDRGVTITEADLDAVLARFHAAGDSVPIRVEHLETPLDPLGHVVALHREGRYLFGTLAFPAGLYAHIQERKANRVSVAFHIVEDGFGKGYRLHETSLVFVPRVPSAGFLTSDQAVARLSAFRAAGKITPAMEGPLSRLLSAVSAPNVHGGALQFFDGSQSASEANAMRGEGLLSPNGNPQSELLGSIEALLEAMPVVQPRGAAVPVVPFSVPRGETPPLSPEMAIWARAMGLDPERVARLKGELG